MEEVCDESHQAQASGEDHELIFGSELLEQDLLIFLQKPIRRGIYLMPVKGIDLPGAAKASPVAEHCLPT